MTCALEQHNGKENNSGRFQRVIRAWCKLEYRWDKTLNNRYNTAAVLGRQIVTEAINKRSMRSAGAVPKNGSAAREHNGAIYGWWVMDLERVCWRKPGRKGRPQPPGAGTGLSTGHCPLPLGARTEGTEEDRESCLYAASQARCFYILLSRFYILLSPSLYMYMYIYIWGVVSCYFLPESTIKMHLFVMVRVLCPSCWSKQLCPRWPSTSVSPAVCGRSDGFPKQLVRHRRWFLRWLQAHPPWFSCAGQVQRDEAPSGLKNKVWINKNKAAGRFWYILEHAFPP